MIQLLYKLLFRQIYSHRLLTSLVELLAVHDLKWLALIQFSLTLLKITNIIHDLLLEWYELQVARCK